jgi:hypothetical protein
MGKLKEIFYPPTEKDELLTVLSSISDSLKIIAAYYAAKSFSLSPFDPQEETSVSYTSDQEEVEKDELRETLARSLSRPLTRYDRFPTLSEVQEGEAAYVEEAHT